MSEEKPRYRVKAGSSPRADAFTVPPGRTGGIRSHFEAAGNGRRLMNFRPTKVHINSALQSAGPTIVARARWLYENDGYAGNAVDEWAAQSVGDGIKPRPKWGKGNAGKKREALDLFWRWTEEADAEGNSDYYGLQEKVAREAYLAGECFIRIRDRRASDMWTVPFQLQMLQSEMLDPSFDQDLGSGRFIRAGIEFDAIGRRVAYWFWREHPYDRHFMRRLRNYGPAGERVRVPADKVIHVFDGRQGTQIRGVPRVARVLVKIFGLEVYDDAELDRKKTAALFGGFLVGRGEPPAPFDLDGDEEGDDADTDGETGGNFVGMEPGAVVDLGEDRDIKFAQPADVGGGYEAFQYRNLLKIAAGLGIPYSYLTGDVTRGNFSNVRTDIIRFRRRLGQWQWNTLIFQLCRRVWKEFVDRAVLVGKLDLPEYEADPSRWWACEHLPPRQEWIDPAKDIKAEVDAIDNGLKSRTQSVAERGYDREELDQEIAEERNNASALGLKFGSPNSGAPGGGGEYDADAARREREDEGTETDQGGEDAA